MKLTIESRFKHCDPTAKIEAKGRIFGWPIDITHVDGVPEQEINHEYLRTNTHADIKDAALELEQMLSKFSGDVLYWRRMPEAVKTDEGYHYRARFSWR